MKNTNPVLLHKQRPLSRYVAINLMVIIALCMNPVTPAHAKKTFAVNINELVKGHNAHIKVLKKISRCFNSKKNRGKAIRAILSGSTRAARSIQNTCVSRRDRAILQSAPHGSAMNPTTRNKVLNTNTPPTRYYKSMSWGLGPSAAIGIFKSQKGFTLDGGFVWNLGGYGSTRLYGSSGTAVDGFAQLNLGVDPIIISLYRSPVESGDSVSHVITGSIEAGVGITAGAYTDTKHDEYLGFTVAVGAGVGFNAGSEYRVKSRVLRGLCPNVKVDAINKTGVEVKVIDVDFHDYTKHKWHSKPTINERIGKNRHFKKTINLNKVDGENSQIRIRYRTKKKFGWSEVRRAWSKKSTCHEGKTYTVNLKRK